MWKKGEINTHVSLAHLIFSRVFPEGNNKKNFFIILLIFYFHLIKITSVQNSNCIFENKPKCEIYGFLQWNIFAYEILKSVLT